MPPGDARLEFIHEGEPASIPEMDNLVGMKKYWEENPEWMEMLDPSSPVHDDKMLEKTLYIDFWDEFLAPELICGFPFGSQKCDIVDFPSSGGRLRAPT